MDSIIERGFGHLIRTVLDNGLSVEEFEKGILLDSKEKHEKYLNTLLRNKYF